MCWIGVNRGMKRDITLMSREPISTCQNAILVPLILVSLVLEVRFAPFFLRSDCVCTCTMKRLCDFRLV